LLSGGLKPHLSFSRVRAASLITAMTDNGNLYADLSGYYDQFCAEVDYAEQCAFAERAFECFAVSGGRDYLDLACGTGQHLLHMLKRGFAGTGLDNSAAMLELAEARCPTARFLLCDLTAFDQAAEFDLITCFLYSIHYSHPTSALQQTLQRAWHALKPGGLFLFNTVDVGGISNQRSTITSVVDGDVRLSFESGWRYSGEGETLDLLLGITRESVADGVKHWTDHHTMTAISLLQLQNMLTDTGFEVTLLEHDYQRLIPWNGKSFNALVAARRP
jgi:SAM-dependent methyltransferase